MTVAKTRKVKTAVSIDAELFQATEERAEKMSVSRSELFGRTLAKFVRDEESREMLARLNESYADNYADEPYKEEEEHLRRMREYQAAGLRRMEEEGELQTG